MAVKSSDDKIQRITKLLEKGGTMLATHHECGAPMFRYQGKVVCPVCDFQEKKPETEITETVKVGNPYTEQGQKKLDPERTARTIQRSADISGFDNIIINKIRELAASLENETELARVRDKMECIEQGLKILKLLRETN